MLSQEELNRIEEAFDAAVRSSKPARLVGAMLNDIFEKIVEMNNKEIEVNGNASD